MSTSTDTYSLQIGPLCGHSCLWTERLVRQGHPSLSGDPRLQYQPRIRHLLVHLHCWDGSLLCPDILHEGIYLSTYKRFLELVHPLEMSAPKVNLRGRHRSQCSDGPCRLASTCPSYQSPHNVVQTESKGLSAAGGWWCSHNRKLHQDVPRHKTATVSRPDGGFCSIQPAWVGPFPCTMASSFSGRDYTDHLPQDCRSHHWHVMRMHANNQLTTQCSQQPRS